MDDTKLHPDPQAYIEGAEAKQRFLDAVKQIVSVSPIEFKKRHADWEKLRKSQRKKSR